MGSNNVTPNEMQERCLISRLIISNFIGMHSLDEYDVNELRNSYFQPNPLQRCHIMTKYTYASRPADTWTENVFRLSRIIAKWCSPMRNCNCNTLREWKLSTESQGIVNESQSKTQRNFCQATEFSGAKNVCTNKWKTKSCVECAHRMQRTRETINTRKTGKQQPVSEVWAGVKSFFIFI